MKDAIIIGGGIAGLTAAWYLRNKDILLLESQNRFGGRVESEKRGDKWLNWGGHVYNGVGSATDDLFNSVGIESSPVPGIVSAMSLKGKLLKSGRVETYPFRVPMSLKSRMAIIKAGAKVRMAVMEYGKVVQRRAGESFGEHQQRIYNYKNDMSFTDYVGNLPEDADAIFRPTVSRSSGEPEEISAGAGIGYFHLVWDKSGGLSRNIHGGPSTLTNKIAETLGERAQSSAEVQEVVQKENSVVVKYVQHGLEHEVEAKYVVMATPAPITKKLAVNIDSERSEALGKIIYGKYVSAAFLTNEKEPQVWDDIYAVATPKRSFTVALHMSNLNRSWEKTRGIGSSLMTFSPASLAENLIEKSDDEIIQIYLNDLNEVFPGISDKVIESHVRKYHLGAPYCFPGRSKLQPILTKPVDRVFLAGDYLGTLYTESSIRSGYEAAQNILNQLEK